jgi:hypothetical protein
MVSPLLKDRGMLIGRRSLLTGLGASCATTWLARPASASVALPLTLSDLMAVSVFALVGLARETTCAWESDSRGKRIVTYTRIETQQVLDGRKSPGSDLYVRTLGGEMGEISQIVPGEAELEREKPAVFFLRDSVPGSYGVAGMAQGHYRLRSDGSGAFRLLPARNMAELIEQHPLAAVTRLRDKTVAECEHMIAEELQPR